MSERNICCRKRERERRKEREPRIIVKVDLKTVFQ